MGLSTAALQSGWLAAQVPAWRALRRACEDPLAASQQRLAELLPVLADTERGHEIGLPKVRDLDDLKQLPIVAHDDLLPWIERIAQGRRGVLITEAVEMLERTGGGSGRDKLVPYTARLRGEFERAVGAWMVDLHRHVPGLLGTRSYWSVSRAVRQAERTVGGIRVGLDDDAEYFGPLSRWAIGRLMAVPGSVASSVDIEAWRLATCRHLVRAGDLGLISVWSPTFMTRLMHWLGEHWRRVADPLPAEARDRLWQACSGRIVHGPTLWPRLRVLSAWGDGFAQVQVAELRRFFPGVAFQPKGVLATEGVVSVPLWGHEGGLLAVTAHLIELREVGGDRVVLPHQADVGGRYQPVLTTGGGLVRYALPDELEVLGHIGRLPRVQLRGRLDRGSDLVGEKLTQAFVSEALRPILSPGEQDAGEGGFATLLPQRDRYILVVDRPGVDAAAVEAALGTAYHYSYARQLGQLQPAEVVVRQDAWKRWEAAVEAAGLSLGDQKTGLLETRSTFVRALMP